MKLPYILFFIKGPFPTDKQREAVAGYKEKAKVVFRNALAVPPDSHSLEMCDGVAGDVPSIYLKTFPNAAEAMATYAEKLQSLSEKVGDEKAPKPVAIPKPEIVSKEKPGKPPAWNPNPPA